MNSLETGFQLNDPINKEWEWKEKKTATHDLQYQQSWFKLNSC